MTKEEFARIVAAILSMFPKCDLNSAQAVALWYELLKDYPYKAVYEATLQCFRESKFAPMPSDIIENIRRRYGKEDRPNAMEAWSLVYKAICNSGYHAVEEFEKLPELVQKAVGSPENLKEMACMRLETVESVEQSHFIKIYNIECQRRDMDKELNPKWLVEKVNEQLLLAENDSQKIEMQGA